MIAPILPFTAVAVHPHRSLSSTLKERARGPFSLLFGVGYAIPARVSGGESGTRCHQ